MLDLDHITPQWAEQGATRPTNEAGNALYAAVVNAGFPAGYQLLCRNCNWSKRLHGECRMAHAAAAACYLTNVAVGTYRRRALLRRAVLSGYGNHCAECLLDDLDVLDIDHVDGGGREERRTLSHNQLWAKLRREGFPSGYRVLCRNCNWQAWRARQRANQGDTPLLTA